METPYDTHLAQANRLLKEHSLGSELHERGLEMLGALAEMSDGTQARWNLAAYFLQVSSRRDAHRAAKYWLERSAADGNPAAVDRLADLHLSGLVSEEGGSVADAYSLKRTLADQGAQRAAWEAAYLLGTDELPSEGGADVSAFARAIALGFPPAYYSLGLRFAEGDGVAQDAAFGHALLRRAADAGYLGAADTARSLGALHASHAFLSASDVWHARLKQNLEQARPLLAALAAGAPSAERGVQPAVRALEEHFVSLGHPSLHIDCSRRAAIVSDDVRVRHSGDRDWRKRSESPVIATCENFATAEECTHLINKVAAALQPAAAYRRGNSANEDAELQSFSGRGHPISPLHTDAVTRILERRVARMTGWSMHRLEPCSIVCYQAGEEYRPHVDYFSEEQIEANARLRHDYGGQRAATFLLYLKAPASGGETRYPHVGVDIAGRVGMAVLHYNVTRDGRPDHASLHAGLPVVDGEKWLWRSTLRQHSLYHSTLPDDGTSSA